MRMLPATRARSGSTRGLIAGVAALGLMVVAPAPAAERLTSFARCITRKGAVLYGATWCPSCRAQLELFGDAADDVDYVECSLRGTGFETPECEDADVHSFPTWEFRDGSRVTGRMSLSRLSAKTGCELPQAAR